jgi:hypothetical protein
MLLLLVLICTPDFEAWEKSVKLLFNFGVIALFFKRRELIESLLSLRWWLNGLWALDLSAVLSWEHEWVFISTFTVFLHFFDSICISKSIEGVFTTRGTRRHISYHDGLAI